jgi:4-amino-4-deoxy-L-arabinose transferase-like glycosyltransferase
MKNKLINFIKSNKALVFILFFTFIFSLFYSFYFRITPAVDARGYDNIALNIVRGNGYKEDISANILRDNAINRIGPLYEFFLAGIYYVFGHNYEVVWIFQSLLRVVTVWLIFLICTLIFEKNENKKKIGLIASGIVGFYPDLIEISAMLMTETLYLFLFCLMIYLFFKYFNNKRILPAVIMGVVFGLATMARPPILFLTPVLLFYFYRKKMIVPAILFFISLSFVFTPWTARNYKVYHEFMPFGVAGTYNFWIGNYHGANGEQEQPSEALNFIANHEIKDLQKESLKQIRLFLYNYPYEFVKLTFLRINKYFSIIRPMGFWFYQTGLGQFIFLFFSAAASLVLFVFGLAGIIKSFLLKNEYLNYLFAFTIITPLIIFVTVVETRYRFQIYPLLSIFAGYFIVQLTNKPRKFIDSALLLSISIIFLNGVLDLILSIDRFKERIGWFF